MPWWTIVIRQLALRSLECPLYVSLGCDISVATEDLSRPLPRLRFLEHRNRHKAIFLNRLCDNPGIRKI